MKQKDAKPGSEFKPINYVLTNTLRSINVVFYQDCIEDFMGDAKEKIEMNNNRIRTIAE